MFIFGPIMWVLGGALALYTASDLARHWQSFWDDDIRPDDRMRAYRVAFLLITPFGVLLHELGHAVAVWQLGGQVVEFNWSFLSGYVVPDRVFPPLGAWWVYFSGNLVSILLIPLALSVLLLPVGRMVKYLAVTFARIEFYVALIGYPLLSLGGVEGDWVGIYGIPPVPLKVVIAVLHIGLLAFGVWLDRRPAVRRWDLLQDAQAREVIEAREAVIGRHPDDMRARLDLARLYLQRRETRLAEQTVQQVLATNPDNADAMLILGALAAQKEQFVQAAEFYQRALERLPNDGRQGAVAAQLGQVYLRMDRADDAVAAYTRALQYGLRDPQIYYWRGRAYLRRHDPQAARLDFEQAVAMDPTGDVGRQAQQELGDIKA
jgi:predicted negative regulator of RcsB-dependent stress response